MESPGPWPNQLGGSMDEEMIQAVHIIDECIEVDSTFPDLAQWLHMSPLSDHYDLEDDLPTFRRKALVMFPTTLLEQFNSCLYTRFVYTCSLIGPTSHQPHDLDAEHKSAMGVFPEIHRVWMTIDHRLFLWNYQDHSDLLVYEGLDQVIVSVSLVPPRANIFVDQVSFLLVLATLNEIVLLALTYESEHEIKLHPTKYGASTELIRTKKIIGTKNGRIFISGEDGSFSELIYESDRNWLSSSSSWIWSWSGRQRKTKRINYSKSKWSKLVPPFLQFSTPSDMIDMIIDQTRKILYILHNHSQITVYDLGDDGMATNKITTNTNLIRQVSQYISRHFSYLNLSQSGHSLSTIGQNHHLISLFIIEPNQSEQIHLVAVTNQAHRLYLSIYDSGQNVGTIQGRRKPNTLKLVHVRLAPNFLPNQNVPSVNIYPVNNISTDVLNQPVNPRPTYMDQHLFMYTLNADDQDILVGISSTQLPRLGIRIGSINPKEPMAMERLTTKWIWREKKQLVPMEGHILDIVRIDPPLIFSTPNELADQYYTSNATYIVLTPIGIWELEKMRPIDHLRQWLIRWHQIESLTIGKFFDRYGSIESSIMCLQIACESYQNVEQIAQAASNWFFQLGRQPYPSMNDPQDNGSYDQFPRDGALNNNGSHDQFPRDGVLKNNSSHDQFPRDFNFKHPETYWPLKHSESRPLYSPNYHALTIYLSRIIQPIWNAPCFSILPCADSNEFDSSKNGNQMVTIQFSISTSQLLTIQNSLKQLNQFLNIHHQFAPLISKSSSLVSSHVNIDSPSLAPDVDRYPSPTYSAMNEVKASSLIRQLSIQCLEATSLLILLQKKQDEIIFFSTSESMPNKDQITQIQDNLIHQIKFRELVSIPPIIHHQRWLQSLIHGWRWASSLAISRSTNLSPNLNLPDSDLDQLHRQCPSYFTTLDHARLQAFDGLQQALDPNQNTAQRHQMLFQSLQRFQTIGSHLSTTHLITISKIYQYLRFYEGVIHLALNAAKCCPDHNIHKDHPTRQECYKIVLQVLDEIYNSCHQAMITNTETMRSIKEDPKRHLDLPNLDNNTDKKFDHPNLDNNLKIESFNLVPKSLSCPVSSPNGKKISYSPIESNDQTLLKEMDPWFAACLSPLPRPIIETSQWNLIHDQLLAQCEGNDDQIWHYTYYQWHLDHGDYILLLDHASTCIYLEPFLHICQPPNLQRHLLWRYYLHLNQFTKAAQTLIQLANLRQYDSKSISPNLPTIQIHSKLNSQYPQFEFDTLEQRLSYLTQAQCLMMENTNDTDHLLVTEIQDKIQVARIQLKIYNELDVLKDSDLRYKIQKSLDHQLYPISDLFNKFAKPYGLCESALSILHLSGHQDSNLVRRLWETMIQDEISKSIKSQYPISLLSQKIYTLARQYYPNESIFPLSYLIDRLEQYSYENLGCDQDQTGWLVETLIRSQIPHMIIFRYYDQLIDSNLLHWQGLGRECHLVSIIIILIKAWQSHIKSSHNESLTSELSTSSAYTSAPYEFGALYSQPVIIAIEKYLVNLSSMMTHEVASSLTQELRKLKKEVSMDWQVSWRR